MSHGEDDDDPQLKSLRAVWLSMPDEDPPERGLDALMAAARIKATEMNAPAEDAAPSWWQRLLAGLRRPPVLALASVLVLVAGAVLIGNRHTKLDSAAPSGGARPSMEDISTQGHATERSYETAPPPPAPTPAQEPHLDHKDTGNAVRGGEGQAPGDDEATAVEVREADQAATIDTSKTKTNATPTGAKTPRAQHTADSVRDTCSTVRAKLQTLQAADATTYRNKIASDPSLAKCLEPAAEAAAAAPAE
ncbi:MAG TPA: hypothetical protein VLB44_05700 [Kofleriaceae bacterium]|nr:hypothetical protein [Kofleriaceae bacterium]